MLADVAEDPTGDRVKGDQCQQAGNDQAAVQRTHDVFAVGGFDEKCANDRGDDGEAAEHQRIHHRALYDFRFRQHQCGEHHGRDDRDRIGFEQVSRHAGAVADVVADVVSDHCRVTRVIFGNSGFDFTHQIGTDVGTLGENAAAQTREDRNQRGTEGQTDQRFDDIAHFGAVSRIVGQIPEEQHGAEQAQSHHQHAGDGAAAEGDIQRGVDTLAGGFGGTHIGAHRHVHADVTGEARQDGADGESRCRGAAQCDPDQHEQHRADNGDGGVLAVQVRLCTGLNCCSDFTHAVIAVRLRKDPADRHHAVDERGDGANQRKDQTIRHDYS